MACYQLDSLYGADMNTLTDDLAFWSTPFGLRLLDVVRYKKQQRVLDLGCGFGFPLIELAMRLGKSSRVYGIDPWDEGIHMAAQRIEAHALTNVEIVQGRAEEMPFKDGYFDSILSNNGINNVQNLEQTFSELRRVSRQGAQFSFTFNTDRTFEQFYAVFRGVLLDLDLQESARKLDEHIYTKRKPVNVFLSLLESNGFRMVSTYKDTFSYHFSDGTAMLDHSFFKVAFMPSWKEIIPEDHHEAVFKRIEQKLNSVADKAGPLSMQVPFLIINSERL
ncbi:MAG: class I SAM-dependent methyltransferase [Bacteroidetes bacterium]|nr:class I SAM-dependent methyltransferase [Bacteroidota bacterium]